MKRSNKSPLWQRPAGSEVHEELATHLELRTKEYVDQGMSQRDARRKALERFGDLDRHAAECLREAGIRNRRWRLVAWLDEVRQDLRFALRRFAKRPGLAILLVGMLALGLGTSLTMAGIWHHAFWKKLPFSDPDRLVTLWEEQTTRGKGLNVVGPANFVAFRDGAKTLDQLAGFITVPASLNAEGVPPMRVGARWVTEEYFEVLGIPPAVGRTFRPGDGLLEDPAPAVISHRLWRQHFGGRRDVEGEKLKIDGIPYEVIGVMPPGAALDLGPARAPYGDAADLWRPLPVTEEWATQRGRWLMIVARLADGSAPEEAHAEASGIMDRQREAMPDFNAGWIGHAIPLAEVLREPLELPLTALGGAVLLLLLVVCINASSLLLSRNLARAEELGLRRALGAGRTRLARQFFAEGLLLAGLAAGAGWVLALGLRRLSAASLPEHLAAAASTTEGAVWVAALAAGSMLIIVLALLTGLSGLRAAARPGSTRDFGGGRGRHRARAGMVFAQTALALVLLVGAALMLQTIHRLLSVDPGFDTDGVVAFSVSPPRDYGPERMSNFLDQLMADVGALPGVDRVGAVTAVPMAGLGAGTSFAATDRPEPDAADWPVADIRVVEGAYFAAMGIELVKGRNFDSSDHGEDTVGSVIVSRDLADDLWPNGDALGKGLHINWGDPARERRIVGVVETVHHVDPGTAPRQAIYFPHAQEPERRMSLVLATQRDLAALAPELRGSVAAIDPTIPVYDVHPIRSIVRGTLADRQFLSRVVTAFGALAFLLSIVGIYGVTMLSVTESRQEVGVRMALGARPLEVVGLFVRRVATWTAAAVVVGLSGAILAGHAAERLFFGVSATDPSVLVGVALLVAASALIAAAIPARKAARVDPSRILRWE
ncbi:MAG: ADOP family duplicated permease [Thermoanaerobaculia bacterium]|nr:ADOP family duplicated permease [Thermoanaerobaculia bacterium]